MDSIYKYPKINGKTNYDVSFERDRLGVCLVVSLNYFEIIFRNNIDFKGSYKGICNVL